MIYLDYIKTLILRNKGKCITLIVGIILFSFASTKEVVTKRNVIFEFKDNGKYNYICTSLSEHKGYSVLSFDEKQKDVIIQSSIADTSIFLFLGSGVIAIFLIVTLFIPAEEGWEFKTIWYNIISKKVICEEDNGTYYYHIDNKLLHKGNRQSAYDILSKLSTYCDNKNLYPDYTNSRITEVLSKNKNVDSQG